MLGPLVSWILSSWFSNVLQYLRWTVSHNSLDVLIIFAKKWTSNLRLHVEEHESMTMTIFPQQRVNCSLCGVEDETIELALELGFANKIIIYFPNLGSWFNRDSLGGFRMVDIIVTLEAINRL